MSGIAGHSLHDQVTLIPCGKHTAEVFTNYCCVNTCLTPLCPDCIDEHNKNHKNSGVFPEVDTLGRVKHMCSKHIEFAIKTLEAELALVIQNQTYTVGDWINVARKNLDQAKQKMQEIINVYFDELLKRYQEELTHLEGRFNFKPIRDDLETILRELKLIDNQLKSNQVFQGIKSTVMLDVKNLVKTYQTKVEDALDISHNIPIDVDFSKDDEREFKKDLEKYISINRRRLTHEHLDYLKRLLDSAERTLSISQLHSALVITFPELRVKVVPTTVWRPLRRWVGMRYNRVIQVSKAKDTQT